MRIFIIYATVEGQTRKIANQIAASARAAAHQAQLFDATDMSGCDLSQADAVIACAPVHAGRYPGAIVHWLTKNADRLDALPGGFVGVSMAAGSHFEAEHEEVKQIAQKLFDQTGWHPMFVHQAAGALRFSQYDFLKRMLMRYIAKREDATIDLTQDHEFTDWAALDAFLAEFLSQAAAAKPARMKVNA